MATDPWVMAVWPKVPLQLSPLPGDSWPRLEHQSTRVTEYTDLRSGDTFWATQIDGQAVGLAWHWLELLPGVVVHADPNGVYTNLRLLAADGTPHTDELQNIVALNTLIHQLPWQAMVMEQVGWQRGRKTDLAHMGSTNTLDERLLLKAA
jgi:hypothetical protein